MQNLSLFSHPKSSQISSRPAIIQDRRPAWSKVSTRSSKKRYLHTSIVFKHYIITYGGSKAFDGRDDAFGDVVVFDINNYEWKKAKLKGMAPNSRYGHTACLYNENEMIIFGGYSEDQTVNHTLFMTLDEQNLSSMQCALKFTTNQTKKDYSRSRHTANIFNHQMYVFGGLNQDGESTNTLWALDLKSSQWNLCPTTGNTPEERYGHSSAIYNNCLFIFGGHNSETDEFMSNLHIMDLNALIWDRVQTIGSPSPRRGMSLVGKNEKLYMFGGCDYSGGHLDDFHMLDLSNLNLIQFEMNF